MFNMSNKQNVVEENDFLFNIKEDNRCSNIHCINIFNNLVTDTMSRGIVWDQSESKPDAKINQP